MTTNELQPAASHSGTPEEIWFSPSQVSTFDLCPRKWAWKYRDGVEAAEEKPAAALGKEVHAQLERWLRDGTPLDLTTQAGKIAMAGIHLLPAPKSTGLVVEGHFGLEMGGHKWQGFKDATWTPYKLPIVYDHKTTKDFRWAKSAEDLRNDVQACFYAADAMHRAGTESCQLQWTYFRTTGSPKAQVAETVVFRDQITPTLEGMCRSADQMKLIHTLGLKARDVPPNASACEAYGGCEYQDLCQLTPNERMKAIMTQQMTASDFMAQLQARKAGAINPPPIVQVTTEVSGNPPPPAGIPMPPPVAWNNTTGKYEIVEVAPALPPPPPVMPAGPTAAAVVAAPSAPVKRTRKPKAAPEVFDDPTPYSQVKAEVLGEPSDRDMQLATLCDQIAGALRTAATLLRSES